jgi:alpha-tubulin suppressor-like RCC1 family protein
MLWAWGNYKNGQLGLGNLQLGQGSSANNKINPRPVQTLCAAPITKIACGAVHSMAVLGDANTISTLSSQYYASNDVLSNIWSIDYSYRGGSGVEDEENYDDDMMGEG